jgi:hypothetical protein
MPKKIAALAMATRPAHSKKPVRKVSAAIPNITPTIGNRQHAAQRPTPMRPRFLNSFFESFIVIKSLSLLLLNQK